ncbi:MAG: ATP-binding protein [Verrucomicrobiota bacterium]
MYNRRIAIPENSFFLFGPRSTGKSTWLNAHFAATMTYDLLKTGDFLRFNADPGTLYAETRMLKPGQWVVIDEIQRVPALLNEVHRLMEDHRILFAMSGSSARKLRKGGTNLLAGRAVVKHIFPLVSAEMNFDFDPSLAIRFGTLPLSIQSNDPVDFLKAYVDTYLREEIQAEALTRNLGAFSRFLEVAARQNGQVTNLSGIARDTAVNRHTVATYFEILCDTLIGFWLPVWRLKPRNRQVQQPKFYLFDSGVARALSGRLPYPPSPEEEGVLLETFLLNEIRAYLEYSKTYYPVHYWRSYTGMEVDVFCETKNGFTAIEIKSSKRWDKTFNKGLNAVRRELADRRVHCFGVYRGDKPMLFDDVTILPVLDFLKRLWQGEILP